MIKEILQDIVENIFEGVIVIGDDYRISYMNRFAAKITGFPNEEARGKFCYEILRAKRCKDYCPIKALRSGEELDELVVDIIARDNTEKFIKAKVIRVGKYWVEIFNDVTREVALEKKIRQSYILEDIITQDQGLMNILNEFPRIAASRVPVLFEGESGVGKEVFCSAIQALSTRKGKPFVKINCAALPETLLESELFGYKKGAFTDARKDKPGLFLAAHEGTLFLDEIGEMSLALQVKLLRAVETGEIIPVGATEVEKVDVRLLAATNKDLIDEVTRGNFREDLFYRLNVVNIRIPPLRERRGDIPLFVDYFIRQFNIIQEKEVGGISAEAIEILLNYRYPGNIRELRNIMEYIFIFCGKGEIQPAHLPRYLTAPLEPGDKAVRPAVISSEKEQLLDALSKARWNRKEAAELLGIDRSTLWRRMKKYGIK
jgi:transcriptional regulator with PAS, ATPase and Fis domain